MNELLTYLKYGCPRGAITPIELISFVENLADMIESGQFEDDISKFMNYLCSFHHNETDPEIRKYIEELSSMIKSGHFDDENNEIVLRFYFY